MMRTFKLGIFTLVFSVLLLLFNISPLVATPTPTPTLIPTATPTPMPTPINYQVWNCFMYNNHSGKAADGLELNINGNTQADGYSTELPSFESITPAPSMTTLRWFGASIPDSNFAVIKFKTIIPSNKAEISFKNYAYWTYPNNETSLLAGPTLSQQFQCTSDSVSMTISNTSEDAMPITVNIQINPSYAVYSFNQLDGSTMMNQTFAVSMYNIKLNAGANMSLPSVSMPAGAVGIIALAQIYFDTDPANFVYYLEQFVPSSTSEPTATPVITPTLTPVRTATPTPTIRPTSTPTPTRSTTPTPTRQRV